MPHPYVTYRPARLVKTATRWYVEYWYRVPEGLMEKHGEWKRFRVFEDINRHKSEEYADLLHKAVNRSLLNGYNPFENEKRFVAPDVVVADVSLNTALAQFIAHCTEKGLRKKSIQSYGVIVNFLKAYFLTGNKVYRPLAEFTKEDMKRFIFDLKKQKNWQNYTTNNYIQFTKTIFNWFVKEEYILKNPVQSIDQLPVNITKHKYYSDAVAEKIKATILKMDTELYEFIEFIYYTGTRPKSEARLLQVENILFDRKLLFIPAHISKNKTDDYISMGDDLIKLLATRKDQPADNYIFGGAKPRSQNYFASLYKPFKDKFALGADYTLYSWKHTRAIHLAQAGADPYQIMKLFRHSSLEITMKYLRDLGLGISDEINQKSKKF
ncbi:MAG: tyrosine-type recombinase/integrase [Chitinophagaceae bacterium]|nr:tyrosine-type recombinase/integrase [Chitinophagaceae bacterium]